MSSPDDLSYLQVRCAKQGEALWHQFTVREVFGEDGVSAGPWGWELFCGWGVGALEGRVVVRKVCGEYLAGLRLALLPSPSHPIPSLFNSSLHPSYPTHSLQVFIADDPSKDVPRSGYVTPETLLCATCQLPECKPGCPAGDAEPMEAEPEGPEAAAAAAASGRRILGGGIPLPAAARQLAMDAAFSEGRSSEDSVLLGLPSPTCSVLPAAGGSGDVSLPHAVAVAAGCGSGGACDGPSGGSSPMAEPRLKQQRLGGGWDATEASATQGWTSGQRSEQRPAPAPAAPAQPGAGGASTLAAALAGISRGLAAEDDGVCSPQPLRPLPPARPPARWEQAAAPPAAPLAQQQATAVGGGGGSSLAAALAAISKGLAEDGLL